MTEPPQKIVAALVLIALIESLGHFGVGGILIWGLSFFAIGWLFEWLKIVIKEEP